MRVKEPKTDASRRTITVPSMVTDALRKHLAKQAEDRLALGLGRDGVATTLGLYAAVMPDMQTEAAAKMDVALRGTLGE